MEIREIKKFEMKKALDLVWRSFLEFEASDYTEERILEFKKTIDDEYWIKEREFYGAYKNNEILGVIATKDKNHIALFLLMVNIIDKVLVKNYMKKF